MEGRNRHNGRVAIDNEKGAVNSGGGGRHASSVAKVVSHEGDHLNVVKQRLNGTNSGRCLQVGTITCEPYVIRNRRSKVERAYRCKTIYAAFVMRKPSDVAVSRGGGTMAANHRCSRFRQCGGSQ